MGNLGNHILLFIPLLFLHNALKEACSESFMTFLAPSIGRNIYLLLLKLVRDFPIEHLNTSDRTRNYIN